MKVVYIADDGTPFKDEVECKDYEWKTALKEKAQYVTFFLSIDEIAEDYLSEETYDQTEKIIVTNDIGIQFLQDLVEYKGFCSYEDITSPGIWVWNGYKFVKVKK